MTIDHKRSVRKDAYTKFRKDLELIMSNYCYIIKMAILSIMLKLIGYSQLLNSHNARLTTIQVRKV